MITGSADASSNADFSRIKKILNDGEVFRQSLPHDWGELRVDRLQPFLCVYRQPKEHDDVGTRQLLSGQASYLLSGSADDTQPPLREMIAGLTELMLEVYGAAFVLEIWSAPESAIPPTSVGSEPATFRILAERHGVPKETIETLEHALLVENPLAEIVVEYGSRAAPPGLTPVLSEDAEERDDVFLLGLEVPPIFRERITGKVIPEELQQLTHHLGRALRQAFYTFAHAHTLSRPAHFHELGPQAMAAEVVEVDLGLARVGDTFDLLLHATPVNAEAAFARFAATGFEDQPEFLYRPMTVDHGALKLALYQVPLELIEDPALHHLYAAQRDELDRQITMLTDRNTPRFLLGSQQVFGGPDERLRAISADILGLPGDQSRAASRDAVLDAEGFASIAAQELSYYQKSWPDLPARIELRNDIPGVMVSKGHFLIGRNAVVRHERVQPLLHHEIGTHILTYYNGLKQPLSQFHSGMPGYEKTQEGLAVLSEYLCGGLDIERLRMLAGRVVAVDSVIAGADFVETYRILNSSHGFGRRDAFTITMRVHRGGGLTKDVVYLRGLIDLLDHLSSGHSLDDLFLGKITLDFIEIVEELQWRRIVSPGPLRPRYLDDPSAWQRLRNLPNGANITDLLVGAA